MLSSSTLFFATFFASIITAGSASSAPAITIPAPTDVVQCKNYTVGWTSGSTGPYDLYVFTGCNDANEDPVYTATGLTETSHQVYANSVSGDTLFIQLVDAAGNDYFSPDYYVGGSSGSDSNACKSHLASAKIESIVAPAPVVAASNPTPTTMSSGSGLDPVANAETAPASTASTKVNLGGAIGKANGAGVGAAPSLGLGLGLMGAAVLALF